MIFTIKSLIDPTLRVGGRSEAACVSAAASVIETANAFMARFYRVTCTQAELLEPLNRRECRIPAEAPVIRRPLLLVVAMFFIAGSLDVGAQAPAPPAQPAAVELK